MCVHYLLLRMLTHPQPALSYLFPQLSWTDVTDALCDCVAASTIAASAKKSACRRVFLCLASAADLSSLPRLVALSKRVDSLSLAPGVGANTVAADRNSALAEIRDLLDRANRHSEQGLGAGTQC